MAVESTMLGLGTEAPDFSLPEPATGRVVSRDDFRSAPALLVSLLGAIILLAIVNLFRRGAVR